MNIPATIHVPEARYAEFLTMAGRWLALEEGLVRGGPELEPWTSEDQALASQYWKQLTQPARQLLGFLADHVGERFTGEALAEQLGFESSYQVAGTLSWPGTRAKRLGRALPFGWQDDDEAGQRGYWMDSDVAALFRSVREGGRD